MAGVLVALDFPTPQQAVTLATEVRRHVQGFKVGLELLLGGHPHAVELVAELGLPVFVDAKLHDIPATVEKSANQLGKRGARWVTAHLAGGVEMIRAATGGLADGSGGEAGILGVTVLTSLAPADLDVLGGASTVSERVRDLLPIAVTGGAEGIICSVHEVALVSQVTPNLITVTPGIRPAGTPGHDQKRVATVGAAATAGADYLVIGRAITDASDPEAAAEAIAAELRAANI